MITINEKDGRVIAFREAEEKLTELQRQRKAKRQELEDERSRRAEARTYQAEQLNREADSLLAGDDASDNLPPDLQQIAHEIDVLEVAIKKQAQVVDAASGKFSRAIQDLNHARYLEIEKRIARAVQELAEANQQEISFFSELRQAGCSSIAFRPMAVKTVGVLADTQSVASFHLAEVKEFIPEALR
jgi:DNA repair exonuclease SbcCD ATPase subunit